MSSINPSGIPAELRNRDQWLLWRLDTDRPKMPLDEHGNAASWTDPSTWLSFQEARELVETGDFDGVGFVITPGDPYIGIDLDGCLKTPGEPALKDWVPTLGDLTDTFIEYSQSLSGLHIFTKGTHLPPWWSDQHFEDGSHEGVEAYEQKFFIVTGKQYDVAGDTISEVDISPFLHDAHEAIVGEPPTLPGGGDVDDDFPVGIYDVISRTRHPEGENSAHPFHGSDTGSNFRVDRGGETWRCWRHDVTGNVRHLLGMETGELTCGEWANGSIDSDRWSRVYNAASERGYDIPPPETDTLDYDWGLIHHLLQSAEPDTSTEAYNKAAKLIQRDHAIVTIRDSDVMYFYDEQQGIYLAKGETYLKQVIDRNLGHRANNTRRNEIIGRVKNDSYIDSDAFTPPEGKVCVQNGVLDLDTRELFDHHPRWYFTSTIQAHWPDDGTPPPDALELWEQALEDGTDDAGERDKIEEFIGYCLETWHHDLEKNLFFTGPRMTGKSTLQEAIEALFGGPPTVTNLTPQQIADTQFDAAQLREAALNTVNDINSRKIEDTGTLKRVFSGESMKMERKYKDPHFARPTAKHLFTANWLPRLVGQDEALYRRILIVEFTKKISESEKDPTYKERLKEADVRQAMLVRAVAARERLRRTNAFTNDRPLTETRRLWDSWRDGHKRFLYTQFDITGDPDDKVERDAYWRAYREYAARKGYQLISNNAITKSLQYVPEVYASGSGDHYGGLRWRAIDAAAGDDEADGVRDGGEETSSNGAEEASQRQLRFNETTQHERKRAIKQAIGDAAVEIDVATVVAAVSRQGFDPDAVRADIDAYVANGVVIREDDMLRLGV